MYLSCFAKNLPFLLYCNLRGVLCCGKCGSRKQSCVHGAELSMFQNVVSFALRAAKVVMCLLACKSGNPSHAAIQALLNRKARQVQKSETKECLSKNGGGSESRVLGFDGWRLRRALTLPKGSDRGARLPLCCLALLDNLISGAYQFPPIGVEPRNQRYSRLQKGSAMVATMPEQLGMRRSADCHAEH